ncbi:MAG: PEGA domain-containing protein [Candidatus Saccharibacteria bacterium]|nr:PEGA domain-containing protein [Candidatus Saccharibacteria bacterium]
MDAERRARRQSLRIIISEVIMVIAVIVTVLILGFVVSGYWLNSDFKIERQGLLQIYSMPTGADIEIDNSPSSWLQRTNTSKTLSAGEHTIKLSKEGYDTWSRTINITEGLLYRLHYPRLFLKNRSHETAFESSANFASITPDRNTMLLANNTTEWQLFNLDSDSVKPMTLNLSEILPFASRATDATAGLFAGSITSSKWANDNEHLLLKIESNGETNWLLLNVKNPNSSINLTKEFNANFSNLEISDQSANYLLGVIDNNLRRIDVQAKQISSILVPDLISFDYRNQDVVFCAKTDAKEIIRSDNASPYYIGILKLGNSEVTKLKDVMEPVKMVTIKFYDDEYIGVVTNTTITLYLKKDFEEKQSFPLSFQPEKIKASQDGDVITAYTGGQLAVLDMEAMSLTEWSTGTDSFNWLDNSMIYAVKDGNLEVYDFNGLNHRTLASNVSAHFPITITSDKYLYYFRDGSLIREYLIEK